MFHKLGVFFWPLGTGDSTTIVVRADEIIFQVDLRHTSSSEDEETESAPIVNRLVETLPKRDGISRSFRMRGSVGGR